MLRGIYIRLLGHLSVMQPLPTAREKLVISRPSSSTAAPKARLPRLPVPDLAPTLERYLKSLEPFILEDESRGGTPFKEAYDLRSRWAEDFKNGIGQVCQERLKELDRASPNNWLDDNIWLKKAYHEWRAPLLVNSNWWLSLKYDTTVPLEVLNGNFLPGHDVRETGITRWQVRRASWMAWRVLDFKAQLERQEIYPDTTKTGIWFQTNTARIFNTARLPRPSCDTFAPVPSPALPTARAILLSIHDFLYAVEVLGSDLSLIEVGEFEKRIIGAVVDAGNRMRNGERAVPISVLSADERDRWAENQSHLLSISTKNHDTLTAINNSIIGVSLDHYTYILPSPSSVVSPSPSTPDSPMEMDAHLHNLRSSHPSHPARNRWHDKPLTLIFESNTRAGAIGEHSPVDALVPSIIADYAVVQDIDEDAFGASLLDHNAASSDDSVGTGWKRLDWVVDERIQSECLEAEERAREIAEDSDDSVLRFDSYGTEWIKNEAKLAPDAYIQMAMQLAWYRIRGSFTATYETGLTRLFQHGRTETIRTFSTESREWVLSMVDPSASSSKRISFLHRAIRAHSSLTRAAATGKGIDRHLLGLRCMLRPNDGERHELFEDELFSRSQTWKLSTSGLSAGFQFRGTGFGTPEHDGYGINYIPGPAVIKFGIESKHSCPQTSTSEFIAAIEMAMNDMKAVCLTVDSHL